MFEKLLSKLGESLDKHGISYMIIGGQAVLLYGEPRLTRDIDITLGVGLERLSELLDIVSKLGLELLPEKPEEFTRDTMVLPVCENSTGIRVDFIFSYTPYEAQAINHARDVKINDKSVKFATPEDVIIHKIFSGRAVDIEDVKNIYLKTPQLDIKYIEKWLKEFSKGSKENFLKIFKKAIKIK